jgi:hypothetical protein
MINTKVIFEKCAKIARAAARLARVIIYLLYRVYQKKGNRTSARYCIGITLRMNEIF